MMCARKSGHRVPQFGVLQARNRFLMAIASADGLTFGWLGSRFGTILTEW
jgi:hypothetical protein